MADTIRAALLFLINTLFNLYLLILLLRVLLVWIRADYFNSVTQFVVKTTNAVVKPVRKLLPNVGNLELSTVIVIFAIECLKFYLIACLNSGMSNWIGLPILAAADIMSLLVQVLTYAIILQVVFSWLQPHSPINRILYHITFPLMNPIRRLVPTVGGIDITPIPALMLLQLLGIIVVHPLMEIGQTAAFS